MSSVRTLTILRFRRDENGAVAMLFGLMALVIFFMAGVALDFSRAIDLKTRVSDAIDSASLAVGRELLNGNLSDQQLIDLGKTYFTTNLNLTSPLESINEPDIQINREAGTVDINVQSTIETTLARIGGYKSLNVPVASAAIFKQSDIEVGMALDITGSMKDSIGGKRKIDSLKSAFKEFAEELYPKQENSPQKVRIALAPYSASVKLGALALSIGTKKSTDGCVSERQGGGASDSVGLFHVKADSPKDVDPTGGLSNAFICPPSGITPLSDDKDTVVSKVNAYVADGSTGGHFGVQWAWNMISEDWSATFSGGSAPDAYELVEKDKLIKAVVLMTDGEFNTAFHGTKSSQQAIALCGAMKGKGVKVFSIGFGLGSDPNAIQTLKSCATTGDGYFANAENEAELSAAFKNIASKLTQLRLSK
jgi:Flp pilus assembly protein TadG